MRTIYEKIQELEAIPSYSKHQQLVNGFINAIDEKMLGKGDTLPSVNTLIKEDRKSTRLNSSHIQKSRMPSSA